MCTHIWRSGLVPSINTFLNPSKLVNHYPKPLTFNSNSVNLLCKVRNCSFTHVSINRLKIVLLQSNTWCKMKTKNNTEKVSTETSWKLLADLCHKADKNELLRKAIKKLANMNQGALEKFLGKIQTSFGGLKRVISNIKLEATTSLNVKDFFKLKENGGVFKYVDSNIFNWFDGEVKNYPAIELASYELIEDITDKKIINDAKTGGIYVEVDLAHIKQICERHIVKGEKLLRDDGHSNLFWVRNTKSGLCRVNVYFDGGGWFVYVDEFIPSYGWYTGYRSFFRN